MHEILHIAWSIGKYFNSYINLYYEAVTTEKFNKIKYNIRLYTALIFKQFLIQERQNSPLSKYGMEKVLFFKKKNKNKFICCSPNYIYGHGSNQTISKLWVILKIIIFEGSVMWNKLPFFFMLSLHLSRIAKLRNEFWIPIYFLKDSNSFPIVRTFGY